MWGWPAVQSGSAVALCSESIGTAKQGSTSGVAGIASSAASRPPSSHLLDFSPTQPPNLVAPPNAPKRGPRKLQKKNTIPPLRNVETRIKPRPHPHRPQPRHPRSTRTVETPASRITKRHPHICTNPRLPAQLATLASLQAKLPRP